jgi:hypothetical protein
LRLQESISQTRSAVGIANISGSSVLISVRVAMMPRHREARRVLMGLVWICGGPSLGVAPPKIGWSRDLLSRPVSSLHRFVIG